METDIQGGYVPWAGGVFSWGQILVILVLEPVLLTMAPAGMLAVTGGV